jgi:hypothetical protein
MQSLDVWALPDDVVMALFGTISAPSEQCVLWLPEKKVVAFCYS